MNETELALAVMDDDGSGCAITTSPSQRAAECWPELYVPDTHGRHRMSTTVLAYDEANDQVIEVSRAEAAAGMVRFARTLGPGSPACAVWERKALEMLAGAERGETLEVA